MRLSSSAGVLGSPDTTFGSLSPQGAHRGVSLTGIERVFCCLTPPLGRSGTGIPPTHEHGNGQLRLHPSLNKQKINAPLQIGGEVTAIAVPEVRPGPVGTGHQSAALQLPTLADELVVGAAVAHGVVEADLFPGLDIPQGDQTDLPPHSPVGPAAVVDAVGPLGGAGGDLVEIFFHLNRAPAQLLPQPQHLAVIY